MSITLLRIAQALSDDELQARAKAIAARERGAIAELIAHLSEIETRGLELAAGYGSMFAYCREALLLSEHESLNRIEVARAARRFPVILDLLAEGAVHLTAVRLLAPHLTADNHLEVLESAHGATKTDVERLVARLAPKPDVATSVRKLPASTPVVAPPIAAAPNGAAAPLIATAFIAMEAPSAPTGVTRPAVISALSPDRYKLQLTIGGETLEKLRLAKDMLRHADPSGNEAAILDRALTLLLAELAKKKFAATDRPRSPLDTPPTASVPNKRESRHVPAEVKRAVWVRDLGYCAFVGTNGRRCGERAFVEFHHVRPYVEGGPPTIANIELRCRRHNAHEWRRRSTEVRIIEEEWLRRQLGTDIASAGRSSVAGGTAWRPRTSSST